MRCPADAIPEHFDVDLTGLEIGDSVHISAITLPEGVKPTTTERDFTVATIVGRAAEEAGPGAAAAAAAEPGAEEAAAPAEAAPEKRRRRRRRRRRISLLLLFAAFGSFCRDEEMKLFVGLGNPGAEYAFNRHNVGFMAVDAIAAVHGFRPGASASPASTAEGKLGREQVLLLKPQTYMNESGRAAGEARALLQARPCRHHRLP